MKTRPKAGLLPLYLALYDQRMPEMRQALMSFLEQVAQMLCAQGIELIQAPICRLKTEVSQAVRGFESQAVNCIVTLHLAYSPSLEALDALLSTPLPIVMCDTTMDAAFDSSVDPIRLLYNHGIHGVQDLASTLKRYGRDYIVLAGHVHRSDVIARTSDAVRAARCAWELTHTKALRVGPVFDGMGDFAVSEALMQSRLGIQVDAIQPDDLCGAVARVTKSDIELEVSRDHGTYVVEADGQAHRRALRIGLGLRHRLESGGYNAFSMHFGSFSSANPNADTVPFLEASKAMARGVGYAGEGDVLCAALVGALSRSFGDTTFTEMFCPDWQGEAVFVSHMGEFNPATAEGKVLLCDKPMPFCESTDTVILAGSPRAGSACLVNLAPQPDDTFALIAAPVEILPDGGDRMRKTIRGWFRPNMPIGRFLESYSGLGGTHHVALLFGEHQTGLRCLGRWLGIGFHWIG